MQRFAAVDVVDGDGDPIGLYAVIDREAEAEGDDDVPPVYESADEAEAIKLAKALNKPVKRGDYEHVPLGDSGLLVSPNGADICRANAAVADDLIALLKTRRELLANGAV